MTKKILRLPVTAKYFHQIREGIKDEEYRLTTEYWKKRIKGKIFDEVHVTLGYPKSGDHERVLVRPWRGYSEKVIIHEHFGKEQVDVFAIIVN